MSEPIRVLHVFSEMNRGGAETMIMNLYRYIDRSKIQFDFIVHTQEKCSFDDEIEQLGGRIFRISRYVGKNHFSYKNEWKKFFDSHSEFKIIHGHVRSTASVYLKIAKRYNLITIAHSHSTASRGNIYQRIVKRIMQLSIKRFSDYRIACSENAGNWLFGKSGNYKIIKNSIDPEKFVFSNSERNHIRNQYNITEKKVVGHVGNFERAKNHFFLLDIFSELLKIDENFILLLVGDGKLRDKIENRINEMGIRKKVILVGSKSNVNSYLCAMDFFIFPSLHEGLGIAVIEAQSSGLPCFVSNRIPTEANISSLVTVVDLKLSPKVWAKKITQASDSTVNRNNGSNIVEISGYGINSNVEILGSMYLELANKLSI